MPKLTKAQRRVLERIASGEEFGQRLNYMFCPPAQRYVYIFRSDGSVIPQRTLDALLDKGFIAPGTSYREITPAGRASLSTRNGGGE